MLQKETLPPKDNEDENGDYLFPEIDDDAFEETMSSVIAEIMENSSDGQELVEKSTFESVAEARRRGLVPQTGDWQHPRRWVKPQEKIIEYSDIPKQSYGEAKNSYRELKGLAKKPAEFGGDGFYFYPFFDDFGESGIAENFDLNTVTPSMRKRAAKQMYNFSQKSLIHRGLPEKFYVFRGGKMYDDPDLPLPTSLNPGVAARSYFAQKGGSEEFLLTMFEVDRKNVLLDRDALVQPGGRGASEQELVIRKKDLKNPIRINPITLEKLFKENIQKQMSAPYLAGESDWNAQSIAKLPKKTGFQSDSDFIRELAEEGQLNEIIEEDQSKEEFQRKIEELYATEIEKQQREEAEEYIFACIQCEPECNCTNNMMGCSCNHDCLCSDVCLAIDCEDEDFIIDIGKLIY